MARILVLQHSPYEPLGMIIHTLKRMRLRIRYVNFARDPLQRIDISGYHGLVVLGGAMHPSELASYPHLTHEIELIQAAIGKDLPVLGICLGSQLLNIALGGKCYSLNKAELGWVEVQQVGIHPMFAPFENKMHVFQWHQYANQLSDNVEVILQNDRCVQAFCYQERCVGLQFHLEVDEDLIRRWLEHPDYLENLKQHLSSEDIQAIRLQTAHHLTQSVETATHFFANFCRLFDKKQYALSSKKSGRDLY